MRKRVLLTLALLPVIFLPTCYATYRLIALGGKEAVSGEPRTDFPVLIFANGRYDVVSYASNSWKGARLLVPESERATLQQPMRGLNDTQMQRNEGDHIQAGAVAEPMQGSLQRIRAEVHREGGMGTRMSQSWYDTDGVRVIPRYERQYSPSWNGLVATIVAGPLSLFIAVLIAGRTRRASSSETVTNS